MPTAESNVRYERNARALRAFYNRASLNLSGYLAQHADRWENK